METALAASMGGWIDVTEMRCLKLLGMQDGPGAARSFLIHNALAALAVASTVVLPLLLGARSLAKLMSNDAAVCAALQPLLWVLTVHAQSRMTHQLTSCILIGIGRPRLTVLATASAFYAVGAPIALVGAFTDLWTTATSTKMVLVVACTAIAQTTLALVFSTVLCRIDWRATAALVHGRAHSDARAAVN